MSVTVEFLKEAGAAAAATLTVLTTLAGGWFWWRRAVKDGKGDAKSVPVSDNRSDHFIIVQTRLGEISASVSGLIPVVSQMLKALQALEEETKRGRSEAHALFGQAHGLVEKLTDATRSIERALSAYIATSSQAFTQTQGNTEILGRVMAQVRDEIQNVKPYLRELMDRLTERRRRGDGGA